jgi:WD40 repeat protein
MTVALSPDGGALAALSKFGRVTAWDVATGAKIGSTLTNARDRDFSLFLAPGGRLVGTVYHPVNAGPAVGLWDVVADRRLAVLEVGYPALAFAPDGRTGYVVMPSDEVGAFAAPAGSPRELPGLGPADTLVMRTDGAVLAARHNAGYTVTLWDVAAGVVAGRFDLPAETAEGPATFDFAPDGRLFLLAPHEGRVGLFDVTSGRRLARLPLLWSQVGRVPRFSADGRVLLTASLAGVRAWALPDADGEAAPLFEARAEGITDAFPLPEGRLLTFSRRDGRVRIWPAEVFRA